MSHKPKKKIKKPSTALIVHEGIPVEAEEIKKPETLTVKIGFKVDFNKILEEALKARIKQLKPKSP